MAGRSMVVGVMLFSAACAHGQRSADNKSSLGAGRYAVESIRSRATLDGQERLLEISEDGSPMVDPAGVTHVLTQRGALTLWNGGSCRLALAVSVDGEEPGVSDRACTWSLDGDHFLLGDETGHAGTRTVYQVSRAGERVVLEGVVDLAPDGKVIGDAKGERIVLVERSQSVASSRPVERTVESRPGDVAAGADL